jgi:hypothetical protein
LKKALCAFWLVVMMLFSGESRAALLCGSYVQIRAMLERQQETLSYRGLDQTGSMVIELFLSRRAGGGISYSLLVRFADKPTCLIVSSFFSLPVESPARGFDGT